MPSLARKGGAVRRRKSSTKHEQLPVQSQFGVCGSGGGGGADGMAERWSEAVTLYLVPKKFCIHIGIRILHKFDWAKHSNSNRIMRGRLQFVRNRLTIPLYRYIIIINHPQFGNFVWSGVLLFGTDSGGDGQPLTLPQGAA